MTSCSIDREYSCVKLFNIFPILIHSISFPCNITLIAQKVTTVSKAVNMTSWNVHRKVWVTVVVTILLFCIVIKSSLSRANEIWYSRFFNFFQLQNSFHVKTKCFGPFPAKFQIFDFFTKKTPKCLGLSGKILKNFQKSIFQLFSTLELVSCQNNMFGTISKWGQKTWFCIPW